MNMVICPDTGKPQEYRHPRKGPEKPKWTRAMENDIGCLWQGIRDIEGTYTFFFVHRHDIHQDSNVTYIHIVCDIRTQKIETHRVELTVGGDKLTYDGPLSTPKEYLTTAKLHWNIVLSTPYRKYLIVDVKNFYLNNPMKKSKYYKIAIKIIPQEIIDKFDMQNKQSDGYIYVRVKKGM